MNNKIQILASEVLNNTAKSCAKDEQVYRYHQNLLSDHQKGAFEEHLKVCTHCSVKMFDLRKAEAVIQQTELDPAMAREISETERIKFKNYLESKESRRAPVYFDDRKQSRWYRSDFLARLAPALGFVVIFILFFSVYRELQYRNRLNQTEALLTQEKLERGNDRERLEENYKQELEKSKEQGSGPLLSGTTVESVQIERTGAPKIIELNFDSPEQVRSIVFSFPGLNYESYAVEVASEETNVWKGELQSQKDPELNTAIVSLLIRGNSFDRGDYNLSIFGKSKEESKRVALYTLRIR